MKKPKYKLIIFDLGRVLVDFNHWFAARRIVKYTNKSLQETYNLFFDSSLTKQFEEGKLSGFDFFSRLKKKLKLNISYRDFVPIWNEIFFISPKNRRVHRIAKIVKTRYKILLLSNINKLHFEYIKKKFPQALRIFPKIVLSYEVGFRKPHPVIYKKALKYFKAKPKETIYIDDRADLIEKAALLGIRSLHFQSVGQLKKDLASLGIKI